MANPQTENGFTKVANEILEALIRTSLSSQELKITLLVIRKTYGFSKKVDFISLTQMAKALGCSKIRCAQVVKNLESMKILTVNENINGVGKSYRFNKDYEQWNTVNKNINRIEKTKETVNVFINHKINNTKEINPLYPPKGDGACVSSSEDERGMLQRREKFWNAYPRKHGKGRFEIAWGKMLPSESLLEEMLKALEVQKKSPGWKREGGRFIPSPSKWLEERHWEGVLETEKPFPVLERKVVRETYSAEDLEHFDKAREKGLAEIKKKLGLRRKQNANCGN
jgi:phage replication O-like protein O